jgi:hypothetical protein
MSIGPTVWIFVGVESVGCKVLRATSVPILNFGLSVVQCFLKRIYAANYELPPYFPLFLVLVSGRRHSIFYLSADLQTSQMFRSRAPPSDRARRAGWQGFIYDLTSVRKKFVRLM